MSGVKLYGIDHRPMRRVARSQALLVAAWLLACSCGHEGALNGDDFSRWDPGDDAEDRDWHCQTDGDCPTGLVCRGNECVSPDDERPPEEQIGHVFMRPGASARYIYALSPFTDTLAIIDATTLEIETIPLAAEPSDLAVLPDRDAVAVVSREGRRLTLLASEDGEWKTFSLALERRFPSVSVCGEGRWAVLWTPDGTMPDAGAEGIVSIVDLSLLESGEEPLVVEKAAGRRHTDVFFRREDARTVDIVLIGKEEMAIIEVEDLERPLPLRLPIPSAYTDIGSRQVIVSAGGDAAILRSFVEPSLLVFHTSTRETTTIPLPAVATDLALVREPGPGPRLSMKAIVALRSAGLVGWFNLEDAILEPEREDLVETIEIEGVVPGQVSPSSDGRYVAVFTNSEPSRAMAWLDFVRDEVLVFDRLQKWVQAVGIGPDGRTAIVLHRPNPDSTIADPYERVVDKSEGYSIVDLEEGFAQLKLTEDVPPRGFVFSVDGDHAAVILSDGASTHRLDTMDLRSLTTSTLSLASKPRFSGALPADPDAGSDRVWVTQEHPAGRISFVSLATRTMRTVTGYDLNAEIE